MNSQLYRQVKLLLGIGLVAALLFLFVALIVASEASLSLWQQLQEAPDAVFYGYVVGFALFVGFSVIVLWRFFKPRQAIPESKTSAPPSEDIIKERVSQAVDTGINVEEAKKELKRLSQRRESGQIYVAVFGDISTGKSAIIKALANVKDIRVGVTGGTTRTVEHYAWQSVAGDQLILTDIPGLNEADGVLTGLAQEEAIRAHIVVYVCDGDLTQSQFTELDALLNMNKPVILAINKSDRYASSELESIKNRLSERLTSRVKDIVMIQSGGVEEVIRILPDSSEEVIERPINTDLSQLQQAIQNLVDHEPGLLDSLRDGHVFMLVAHKLEKSALSHKKAEAEEVVKSSTRKAFVGSLAAVSPGTDILIQGYLATSMLKELCDIYDVPVRQLDIERFLDLSQSHLGKTTPLILAVAGNGLKAFPGVGTLVGGIVHAVAYGIIFDALGRSVTQALETRGDLLPVATADLFKEKLSDNLEARTKRFIQMALQIAEENKK